MSVYLENYTMYYDVLWLRIPKNQTFSCWALGNNVTVTVVDPSLLSFPLMKPSNFIIYFILSIYFTFIWTKHRKTKTNLNTHLGVSRNRCVPLLIFKPGCLSDGVTPTLNMHTNNQLTNHPRKSKKQASMQGNMNRGGH